MWTHSQLIRFNLKKCMWADSTTIYSLLQTYPQLEQKCWSYHQSQSHTELGPWQLGWILCTEDNIANFSIKMKNSFFCKIFALPRTHHRPRAPCSAGQAALPPPLRIHRHHRDPPDHLPQDHHHDRCTRTREPALWMAASPAARAVLSQCNAWNRIFTVCKWNDFIL